MSGERTYWPADIVVFHKTRAQWGELSNMAPGFSLVVCGVEWRTPEALYQASRFPHLRDIQSLILDQPSPMSAKMASKPYRDQTRPDWDRVRTLIMRWVLRVKLAQHFRAFAAVLRATGGLPIVERSHKDRFWGAVADDRGALQGANVLGRLLMELRQEVQDRPEQDLLTVAAPAVDDFVLMGTRVGVVHAADSPDARSRLF